MLDWFCILICDIHILAFLLHGHLHTEALRYLLANLLQSTLLTLTNLNPWDLYCIFKNII